MHLKYLVVAVTTLSLALSAQTTWAEAGDAGDLPGSEQVPVGPGPLTQITGATSSSDQVDLYLIEVIDPSAFSANSCNPGTFYDTRLHLFALDGTGLSFNDDVPCSPSFRSGVTGQFLPGPGQYLLAVNGWGSGSNGQALNQFGNPIWDYSNTSSEWQPNGASGSAGETGAEDPVLDSWSGGANTGNYQINLTGAFFPGGACGSNKLNTFPNYAGGTTFGVGSVAYFELVVTALNGVSICSIDVHTTNTGPISGRVFLHKFESNFLNLGPANTGPINWDTVGCLAGTGNGLGNPSPMSILNNTNSLDLSPGSYVVAIGNGNFDNVVSPTTGANSDLDIDFRGGFADDSFGGSSFGAGAFNGGFLYTPATSPISTSPGGISCVLATCAETGSGCGKNGIGAHIYEGFSGSNPFDLVGFDIEFVGAGGSGGVSSTVDVATPIIPPVAAALGLGDDENSALMPLGFTLEAFGLPCIDTFSVSSNGYIWLGSTGAADGSPTAAEFHGEAARVAVYWADLLPAAAAGAGTIHVDLAPNLALVTWQGMAYAGGVPGIPFATRDFDNLAASSGFINAVDPGGPYYPGWADGGGDYEWRVHTGPTGTVGTGPSAAVSLPNYMYCETSGADIGSTYIMNTGAFLNAGVTALEFDLHRVGAGIGTLVVRQTIGAGAPMTLGAWTGAGTTNDWEHIVLPVNGAGANVKFQFDYTSGAVEGLGDIAIDNFQLIVPNPNSTVTFQCEITSGGVRTRYDSSASNFLNEGLVGFSNGFAQAVTPDSDLNAGIVGPFASSGGLDMTLSCASLPLLGGSLDLALSNLPALGLGTINVGFGFTGPGVPLPTPQFAPGCSSYLGGPSIGFPLILNASPCTDYVFNIAIPSANFFSGLPISAQGVGYDALGSGQFLTSNAVNAVVGGL